MLGSGPCRRLRIHPGLIWRAKVWVQSNLSGMEVLSAKYCVSVC